MRFSEDWLRSKTLWLVSVPGVVTAFTAWASGEMKWWEAMGAALAALAVSTLRDTVARHAAGVAERDEQRLAIIRQSELRAQAAFEAQQARQQFRLEIPEEVKAILAAENEKALEAARKLVEDEARAAYDGTVLGDLDPEAGEGDDEDDEPSGTSSEVSGSGS